LTPRDSTIAGLESLLLGAHASGVRNVLAVTGDAPQQGHYPGSGAVRTRAWRLPGPRLGVRPRRDRPRGADDAAERGRRLPRPRDRRADVVLPGRGGESDRGRYAARSQPVP